MELEQQSSSGMSPKLYEAATSGNIEVIRAYKDQLNSQFTPTKNTLLHVLAQSADSGEYVKEILNCYDDIQTLQSILLWVNTKGETALHIAARNGRLQIVNALLQRSKDIEKQDVETGGDADTITKQMLRMTTKVGDTALHEAIRFRHNAVAELLFNEDPEFVYPSNDMSETPLYLAAENSNCELVRLILNKCKAETPSYDGPCNMTALHAAILHDCHGCIGALLERLPILTKKADSSGWTALHLAARFNLISRIRQLLEADPSLAYITAGHDNNKTALHIATSVGHVEAMEEILTHNPDCWEVNTSDDQNLLHIAIDHEEMETTTFILKKPWAGHLANEKDANGDTPLHLYVISRYASEPSIVDYTADVNAYNKNNFTPFDLLRDSDVFSYHKGTIRKQLKKMRARSSLRGIATTDNNWHTKYKSTSRENRKRMTLDYKKLTETYMIVSTLIATVTFAAAFTLPGGYDGSVGSHQGMAVLTRKAAFKSFVISNTIAVISSILAVFLLLLASMTVLQVISGNLRWYASFCLKSSVIAMLVAFTTGSYCVLDNSLGLQISVSVLGSIGILILYFLIMKRPRAFVTRIVSLCNRYMRKYFALNRVVEESWE